MERVFLLPVDDLDGRGVKTLAAWVYRQPKLAVRRDMARNLGQLKLSEQAARAFAERVSQLVLLFGDGKLDKCVIFHSFTSFQDTKKRT